MENRQKYSDLKEARIPWSKSRKEAWKEISARMGEQDQSRPAVRGFDPGRPLWIAMAASLLLLLAISTFMRLHTRTVQTLSSKHLSHQLPDGSSVELNAETTLKYHPYWWFASRRVSLQGEAFFQVKKGRPFLVQSPLASTRVLGTSFNIYTRESRYRAQCHSGKVEVESALSGNSVILGPGEEALADNSGGISMDRMTHFRKVPAWTEHMVLFVSTPLELVLEEIERQYGIVIECPESADYSYTGNFSLDESLENVLALVCRPFGLEYEQHTGKTYRIKAKRSP